jgi:hypothetical protein
MRCRVCREHVFLNAGQLCGWCEVRAEIVRQNLEGARKSKKKPPTKCPPCDDCGGPQAPVLFRPEGPWTFYCVRGCYACNQCRQVYRYDQTCEHDRRLMKAVVV